MATAHQGNSNGQAGSDPIVVDLTELFRQDEPEGKTVDELASENALTVHQVRHRLRALVARGEVEYAGTRAGKRIDGKTCQVPVYRTRR